MRPAVRPWSNCQPAGGSEVLTMLQNPGNKVSSVKNPVTERSACVGTMDLFGGHFDLLDFLQGSIASLGFQICCTAPRMNFDGLLSGKVRNPSFALRAFSRWCCCLGGSSDLKLPGCFLIRTLPQASHAMIHEGSRTGNMTTAVASKSSHNA